MCLAPARTGSIGKRGLLTCKHRGMTADTLDWLRSFSRVLWAHLLCVMLVPLAYATPPEVRLTTAQIRSTLYGHCVTDGLHWTHEYFQDGRLERSDNARIRTGRWSAQNNQLCLLLPEVSRDSPVCFDVVRVGDQLQYSDAGSVVYVGTVKKSTSR